MDAQVGRPQFNDGALRRMLGTVGPEIETFTDRLNKLSSDIKQLEAYLDSSGVRVAVRVALDQRHEFIVWEKGEPDRWRVMYLLEPDSPDDDHAHCPLIEAPVEVRLRARKNLPYLLQNVASAVATDDDPPTTADDDTGGGPPQGDDDIPF